MIVTEFYRVRSDGVRLVRNYSDQGYYIQRDGVLYEEAIDPENMNRVYTETNEKHPNADLPAEEALAIILGGEI